MHQYTSEAIYRLSALLENSARSLGVGAVSVRDQVFPLHVAMDAVGPMCWPLAMHAQALAAFAGMADNVRGNLLPFATVKNDSAPYGVEVVCQPAALPFGFAYRFMDAALEHAVCIAMRDLGYTPEEWMQLPAGVNAIPLEPYLENLEQHWLTEQLESGDIAAQLANWPELLDTASLTYQMNNMSLGATNAHAIRFPSAR